MKWTLTIEGSGPGFNSGNPRDVDRLASRFMKTLTSEGHDAVGAVCRVGAEQNALLADVAGFETGNPPLPVAE